MQKNKYRVYQFKKESDQEMDVWLVWCTPCRKHHPYDSKRWTFNGDFEKPTFRESMLIRRKDYICHSFVTDGFIQYLDDCTHDLKGKTVELEREKWSDDSDLQ